MKNSLLSKDRNEFIRLVQFLYSPIVYPSSKLFTHLAIHIPILCVLTSDLCCQKMFLRDPAHTHSFLFVYQQYAFAEKSSDLNYDFFFSLQCS